MKLRALVVIGLVLSTFAAVAGGADAKNKNALLTMLIAGSIDIEQDGSVSGYRLDQPDKLPPAVVQMVAATVPTWHFEPIVQDGAAVKARSRMNLRVVAKQKESGDYIAGIRGASFGSDKPLPGTELTALNELTPPKYPPPAYRAGVKGTVYVIVKVGRSGKAEDGVTEQVNLKVVGDARQMRIARDLLSQGIEEHAKSWIFRPPTRGNFATRQFWLVRVPVAFSFEQDKPVAYGEWELYVPGPRKEAPWVDKQDAGGGSDAILAGTMHAVGSGPRLITPLTQG